MTALNLIFKNKINLKQALIFCLPLFFSIDVFAAPDFPAPPDAKVEWVGRNMQVNGIKSDIRIFFSKKTIEKVVNFYREEWKRPIDKDTPGYRETIASAPWYIISRIEDGYLLTVQVQVKEDDDSESWGYLSKSPLPENINIDDIGKGMPKMSNSRVLSEVKSDDPAKKATTMIIANDHSVSSNVNFYRNYYQSKGWTEESDQELDQGKNHALVYKTRRNRVTMMFMKDKNSTKIVVNNVTHSILR